MTGLVAVYIVLVVIVFVITSQVVSASKSEDFAKAAGVGVAAVSGFMAFVTSLISLKAARELERLKGEEARGTERLKLVVAQRIAAWSALTAAASIYHRTLADLERAAWDPQRVAKAEEEMAAAEKLLGSLPDQMDHDFGNLWQMFWQMGRRIAERASAAKSEGDAALRALWASEGRSLGEHLQALRKAQSDLLASLEPARFGPS